MDNAKIYFVIDVGLKHVVFVFFAQKEQNLSEVFKEEYGAIVMKMDKVLIITSLSSCLLLTFLFL